MSNRNPETHFFRDMNRLSPGDVIITNCLLHGRAAILVLDRRGDWFDLSTDAPAGHISISIDPKGPWRWDRHDACFVNEQGDERKHLTPGVEVQKRTGIDELGWYEDLARPDQVRFHVSPDNLIGNANDPATVAKLHALVERKHTASNPQSSVNAMTQMVELAFAGAEHLLDKRRVSLLVAAMNAVAGMATKAAERSVSRDPEEELAASLMAALMGGIGASRERSQSGQRHGGNSAARSRTGG